MCCQVPGMLVRGRSPTLLWSSSMNCVKGWKMWELWENNFKKHVKRYLFGQRLWLHTYKIFVMPVIDSLWSFWVVKKKKYKFNISKYRGWGGGGGRNFLEVLGRGGSNYPQPILFLLPRKGDWNLIYLFS